MSVFAHFAGHRDRRSTSLAGGKKLKVFAVQRFRQLSGVHLPRVAGQQLSERPLRDHLIF
jgi:hypothetical protein